jgi:hypothetical protein
MRDLHPMLLLSPSACNEGTGLVIGVGQVGCEGVRLPSSRGWLRSAISATLNHLVAFCP